MHYLGKTSLSFILYTWCGSGGKISATWSSKLKVEFKSEQCCPRRRARMFRLKSYLLDNFKVHELTYVSFRKMVLGIFVSVAAFANLSSGTGRILCSDI